MIIGCLPGRAGLIAPPSDLASVKEHQRILSLVNTDLWGLKTAPPLRAAV